jgi:hypothetical protein
MRFGDMDYGIWAAVVGRGRELRRHVRSFCGGGNRQARIAKALEAGIVRRQTQPYMIIRGLRVSSAHAISDDFGELPPNC